MIGAVAQIATPGSGGWTVSARALGLRIGLTRQTIAAIEAGKYAPSLEAAFRIADVFNVPLADVFEWHASAPDSTTQG